jgi:hypothetical protein
MTGIFGIDRDLINAVRGVVTKSKMSKSDIEKKIEEGSWEFSGELSEGKKVYVKDRRTNTFLGILVEKKELDPVDKKAVKKDFDDRKDKDIDNDGDSDDSDEYLHKRRKAVSKAMKNEAMKPYVSSDRDGAHVMNSKGKVVKTFKDMKSANAYLHKNFKSLSEDEDLEEGKKGYKKEEEETPKDDKMTDAQKNDMDGDGEKDKKKGKKSGEKDKVDSIDTDPESDDDTMVKEGRAKSLASHEKEKLDKLKKEYEGGKMHRALRRQYGDQGDNIFFGKLTKMAKGEYDGSETKSESFVLTGEDMNMLEELEDLGLLFFESMATDDKERRIAQGRAQVMRSDRKRAADKERRIAQGRAQVMKNMRKEETEEVDEARGRPPKADDADDGGSKNFVMQMRKSVSLRGQNTVTFDDGSKAKIDQKKAQAFLTKFDSLKKPAEKEMLMKSASKSPKHLDIALKGKIAKDPKPSMLPPLKSEK